MRPNEREISHGRVSWQTHWTHFAVGPVGFIDGLDGLCRATHSLDELRFDPNGVMTVIWCLRAVIQDVQLEIAVFPKAVNPECLADDALKQLRCTNASCVI
jgi:hypothetical protein